jgi:hypothetical protein
MNSQAGISTYSAHRIAFLLFILAAVLRPHLSGIAYPFSQGVFLVPLLVGLGLILLSPDPLPSIGKRPGFCLMSAWLLVAWSGITLLWTADPGQGVREFAALFLNVLAFTMALILISTEAVLRSRWLILMGLTTAFVALRAVYQRLFGFERLFDLLGRMEASGENVTQFRNIIADKRVFAGFLNPNMLAGFLAILIPFMLDMALTTSSKRQRGVLSVLVAVSTGILLLTASLGGILVAAVMIMAVIIARKGLRGPLVVALVVIVSLLLMGILAMRGPDFLFGQDSSVAQRGGYMAAGIRMAAVHPLLGWGAGSSPGALMAFVTEGFRPVTDPHNYLVRAWITWGVPGVTLLAAVLLGWAVTVIERIREFGWKDLPAGCTGLVFGGLAFILHGLIDMDFFVPETAFFGWWIMGAAVGVACGQKKNAGEKEGTRLSWTKLLPGTLALALVIPSLVFFQGEITALRADRLFREGDLKEAAGLYNSAGKYLPYNGRFSLGEGRAVLDDGQTARALELFKRADGLMNASPYPPWELGRIALRTGNNVEAVRQMERALERFPTSPRIRIDLAQAYLRLGDEAKAAGLFREVRQHSTFDPEARRIADQFLAKIGR